MSTSRTVLICHRGDDFDEKGLASWLASFTNLAGIVVIAEAAAPAFFRRLQYERRRIGVYRLLDVLAFRVFYKFRYARTDSAWMRRTAQMLEVMYPMAKPTPQVLVTDDPNSRAAQEFIQSLKPDLAIARCKKILRKSVFSIPTYGTFVLHPGICPEYRNAHGCFWALARGDKENVGVTLLKIDAGIDTGPVHGYYSYRNACRGDSHLRIQYRVVLDNLPAIKSKLEEILQGKSAPLAIINRASQVYGQPWLSMYGSFKQHLGELCRREESEQM